MMKDRNLRVEAEEEKRSPVKEEPEGEEDAEVKLTLNLNFVTSYMKKEPIFKFVISEL